MAARTCAPFSTIEGTASGEVPGEISRGALREAQLGKAAGGSQNRRFGKDVAGCQRAGKTAAVELFVMLGHHHRQFDRAPRIDPKLAAPTVGWWCSSQSVRCLRNEFPGNPPDWNCSRPTSCKSAASTSRARQSGLALIIAEQPDENSRGGDSDDEVRRVGLARLRFDQRCQRESRHWNQHPQLSDVPDFVIDAIEQGQQFVELERLLKSQPSAPVCNCQRFAHCRVAQCNLGHNGVEQAMRRLDDLLDQPDGGIARTVLHSYVAADALNPEDVCHQYLPELRRAVQAGWRTSLCARTSRERRCN